MAVSLPRFVSVTRRCPTRNSPQTGGNVIAEVCISSRQLLDDNSPQTGVPPRPLYVVADVSGIEASATEEVWLITGLVTIVSMLTLLAIALGAFISRRAIDPVIRLAEAVGGINSEQLSDVDWRRVKAECFQTTRSGC